MSQILPNGPTGKTTSPTTPISLVQVLEPVAQYIQSVNDLLQTETSVCNEFLSERLANSGIAGGKRMRPALLLLAGACFGDIKKTHLAAATAIEMFHVATLVHDDVLDGATERRHLQSLNSLWNNKSSILTGDFLFTKAMEIGCRSGSVEAVRKMATACCKVTEGEVTQNALAGKYEITVQQYMDMVSAKTAELCKCACGLGAMLSECDDEIILQFEQYGEDLGIAFQIIDDVLDLVGDEEVVGKTLGTDLVNGKATLPLILCLQQLDADAKERIIDSLRTNKTDFQEVHRLLLETGAIDQAREFARSHASRSLSFARSLAPSPHSTALIQLANFVIERIN